MMVDFLSSASCSFASSDSPSIRGMLNVGHHHVHVRIGVDLLQRFQPVMREDERHRASRIWRRNICSTNASRSGSSSTKRMVAVMRLPESRIDFLTQRREVDRLGQQAFGAALDPFLRVSASP